MTATLDYVRIRLFSSENVYDVYDSVLFFSTSSQEKQIGSLMFNFTFRNSITFFDESFA